MPFGTRGGMSALHNFPADGEYVLSIGDMALARTVPNMEFENTVIALLDGKEFWRTSIGGEEDHTAHRPAARRRRGQDQRPPEGHPLQRHRRPAHGRGHLPAPQLCRARRSQRIACSTTPATIAASIALEGGQQRVPAVHAFQIKGPVKITGMSDSASRKKIFICKPASAADERACAQQHRRAPGPQGFPPPGDGRRPRPADGASTTTVTQGRRRLRRGRARVARRPSWPARCSCIAPRPPSRKAAAS